MPLALAPGIHYNNRMSHRLGPDEQFHLIRRGTVEIHVEAELRRKLQRSVETGVPLRVKVGFDPTAPDLHLGHTVVIQKMRQFQELGHEVYFLIGDFTGLIGDPTGKSETRKPLTREEIDANARTYREQVFKILDPEQTRVVFNSAWLAPLTAADVVRTSAQVTVARMLAREDFAARYREGRPISLHEFLYPLFQAYDSVALRTDVELGGTDQTFNLLVGRDLQRAFGQEPQVAITMPILEGLDGTQKMSKSLGNYVGMTELPEEIYGKCMSIPDHLTLRYFTLVTPLDGRDIEELENGLRTGRIHPMEAKKRLAHTIVSQFWGAEAAQRATKEFERVHQKRETPEEIPLVEIQPPVESASGAVTVTYLVVAAGLVPSNSEARRLIQQGGIYLDGRRVTDSNLPIAPGREYLVQVGRRKFKRCKVNPNPSSRSAPGSRA